MICGTSIPPAPAEVGVGGVGVEVECGWVGGGGGEEGNVTFTLCFTSMPAIIIFLHFHSKFV